MYEMLPTIQDALHLRIEKNARKLAAISVAALAMVVTCLKTCVMNSWMI